MTSVELLADALRDGIINLAPVRVFRCLATLFCVQNAQHGVCVNGCSFDKLVITASTVSFNILTNFRWTESFIARIGPCLVLPHVC